MLVGPSIAGYLTNSYGWRIAFILAAVPNFPLAIIFAIYAKDPIRLIYWHLYRVFLGLYHGE